MDIFLTILASIFLLGGLVGCVAPLLPGPPLAYVGLLLLQLKTNPPFTPLFLWTWAAIVVVVSVLDHVTPIYGTKKFGGSKYGVWGCSIGLLFGLWFGLPGIIFGPLIGAFFGEILANKKPPVAMKAALGSFMGFLLGTLAKLVVCFVMCWYFVETLI